MKKNIWITVCAFTTVMLLFGASAVTAKPKGKVTFASAHGSMDLRTVYDPHTATGSAPTTFKSLVFDSLVHKDENGKVVPALATEWKIGPNWSYMIFKIRRGVQFHNGDPLTADDVKFSFDRAMRKDIPFFLGGEMRRFIKSVEATGDYEIKINFNEPYLSFFDRCYDYLAIVPKNYLEKVGDEGFAEKPIGTGPFRVLEFKRDVFMDFRAVENHYRKTPYIRDFRFLNVKENSTRLAMLKTGEADIVTLHASQIPNVNRDKELRIIWSNMTYLQTLVFFDLSHPEDSPFKDKRVRQATQLGIDIRGIADAIGHGTITPWGSFLASYHPGFDPNAKPSLHDPERAKQLMAEAGYANGFDTVMVSHPTSVTLFEPMVQQLKEIGIRCKLSVPESGTWSKTFVAGNFRGIGLGVGPYWAGSTHPASATQGAVTGAWSHNLATPAIKEAMVRLQQATETDDIAARAKELNDQLFEDLVRIPLWSRNLPFAVNQRIKSYPGVPGVLYPRNFEYLELQD
ncbi:ABC transporter substrate-binding protein [bacterium]|nr:ABC transporter substrate-binding protein [bacterium]